MTERSASYVAVVADATGMRVIGIVGSSDTGKTTLVERLVPALRERGRVATVKSMHHDVTPDSPGKDTFRHREAGAERVVGVAPTVEFEVRDGGKRAAVERTGSEVGVLSSVLRRLDAPEFVLVEGFSASLTPKIATDDRAAGGRVVGRGEDALDALTAAAESVVPYLTVDGVRRSLVDGGDVPDRPDDGTVVGVGEFSTIEPVERRSEEWTSRDALPADWDADGRDVVAAPSTAVSGVRGVDVSVRPPLREREAAVVTVGVAADDAAAATAGVTAAGRELAREWPALSSDPDRVVIG